MKKALSIFLAVVMAACISPVSLTASAENEHTNGYYTYKIENDQATIIAVNKEINGVVIIPSELGGYPVTALGEHSFSFCNNITDITIPTSVEFIYDWAFAYCDNITNAHISGNNAIIGSKVFAHCSKLTNAVISNGVRNIGYYMFYHNENLTNITISNSVTSIGVCAFRGCTNLSDFTIPNSVTIIDEYAFCDCHNLTSIVIPESVISIGTNAFSHCTNLEKIEVEKMNVSYYSKGNCIIETISGTIHSGCKTSIIPSDENITSLGYFAFSGCTGLENLTLPKNITSIDEGAFYECNELTDVWYTGSETDKEYILIDSRNDSLLNATWHYNYKPTPEIKYGLVTENEKISASDALAILHAVVGKVQFTDAQNIAGDVDGNGILNATDALLILQRTVEKINKFPVEEKFDDSSSQPSRFQKNTFANGDYIEYTKSGADELSEWYLILVNKDNVLASYWTPSNLTKIADGERLDSRIITAYNDMINAASKDGLNIYPVSAYRTVDTQNRLFQNKVAKIKAANPNLTQEQAEIEAATVVARPRTSEHECGLAVDFIDVEERFANTKEGQWLKENCTEFGFILRYEKGKESITNVIYEPWHFRFVGIKHAKQMEQLGMCLEEYVEYLSNGGE